MRERSGKCNVRDNKTEEWGIRFDKWGTRTVIGDGKIIKNSVSDGLNCFSIAGDCLSEAGRCLAWERHEQDLRCDRTTSRTGRNRQAIACLCSPH
jgi:hypothetical protein